LKTVSTFRYPAIAGWADASLSGITPVNVGIIAGKITVLYGTLRRIITGII
jgi:hypothetical protein